MTTASTDDAGPAGRLGDHKIAGRFFGHPPGLKYLSLAEAWERFSFSGMQTLLVLYLGRELLLPGHIEHVLGFEWLRHAIGYIFGDSLSRAALASIIFGIYSGGVWLTPLLGGLIADQVLGRTSTIMLGACFLLAGHFLMAFDATFLFALAFLVCGAGCFKTNIAAQVGDLYESNDTSRATGFQLYIIGISMAVIVAPLVCGTLGERLSFHWGFGTAGVGMLIGMAVYLSGLRYYPRNRPVNAGNHPEKPRFQPGDGIRIVALVMALPGLALVSVGNEQMFNAYITWASSNLDLTLFDLAMPVTWLISIDALIAVAAMSGAVLFWRWWAESHRDPDEITKILLGGVICLVAPLLLVLASIRQEHTGQSVGLHWALLFHIVNEVGIANVFPVSLALFSRVAPKSIGSLMIAVMYLNHFVSNLLVGWLGSLMEKFSTTVFWAIHVCLIGAGLLLLLMVSMMFRSVLSPAGRPTEARG